MTRCPAWEWALIAAALVIAALAVMAGQARAQAPPPACAPREQVLTAITGEKYGEGPMIELEGMPTGTVMHIYGNPLTGTWTVVGFPNSVIACILATGKKMRVLHAVPKGTSL